MALSGGASCQGHLLGHVKDIGGDPAKPETRLYTTSAAQPYHTDSCDIVRRPCESVRIPHESCGSSSRRAARESSPARIAHEARTNPVRIQLESCGSHARAWPRASPSGPRRAAAAGRMFKF